MSCMEVAERRLWGLLGDQVSPHTASTTHPISHQFCKLISTTTLVLNLTEENPVKSPKGSAMYVPHGTRTLVYLSNDVCDVGESKEGGW